MIKCPEYLPESMREMISVIGLDDTMTIVDERGGIQLWLPSRPKTDHWLYTTIGKAQFQKLTEYYGSGYLDIPRCAKALQKLKEEQIVAAREDGETMFSLAQKHDMTVRGVRKLLARVKTEKPDNQIDLFNQE